MRVQLLCVKIILVGWLSLCADCAFGGQLFSFDKITKGEFEQAFKGYDKYNFPLFADTIVPNEITAKILKEARARFEKVPPFYQDAYDLSPEEEGYEEWFSIKNLRKFENLDLYGFLIPQIHDFTMYCYDSQNGEYVGEMLCPFTISPGGVLIAQVGHDCDIPLDLRFYKIIRNKWPGIFNFYFFRAPVSGAFIYTYPERISDCPEFFTFWGSENELYLSVPAYNRDPYGIDYYKITVNE